jgi:hypothetical protein
LFLDEVDRATLEVRQGIFELTDSRKLNGHYLHEDKMPNEPPSPCTVR